MNRVDYDPEKFDADEYGNLIPKETKKFAVSVTETLSRIVVIRARDELDALDIIEAKWKDGDIILTDEDFQDDPDFQIEDESLIEDAEEL